MSLPTVGISESSPAGSDIIALGDNAIRTFKVQNREILEVDHVYPTSGQDDDCGKHKQLTLLEQADIGTGTTGYCALGAQTVSGKPELVYTDEDDNDVQLTSGGKLGSGTLSQMSLILNHVYPIGSVVTLGVSTNPATLFGIGTWTAIAGKVIVGIDGTQTEFDTLNETGGEKTHVLTEAELAAHKHIEGFANASGGVGTYGNVTTTSASAFALAGANQSHANTSSVGSDTAHNNLQPYIVKYVWERTA